MHERRGTTRDEVLLALLASAASITAFLHYYRHHEVLLYGDAVAHINIARRVFDSLTPGPLQLGTVWLPLPHLLMTPFLISNWMWRTGVGGSIVSMIAYVVGTVGVYRLAWVCSPLSSRVALLAALIYAANPNLLYLQATAMTESLYLALFIWSLVFVVEWWQPQNQGAPPLPASFAGRVGSKNLERCGVLLAAAMLTRYDGWFLAACVALVVLGVWALPRFRQSASPEVSSRCVPTRALIEFVLLLVAIAGVWFAYNYREFGNSTEFATGPYSARAIERRTANQYAPHPGYDSPVVAAEFFLKSAKLNVGVGPRELPLMLAAALGLIVMLTIRTSSPALLLWIPVPFYALSIAYGGVPIFLPVWWPFSYYNTRYGLELLPAIAVFTAVAFAAVMRLTRSRATRLAIGSAALFIVAGCYASVWSAVPICLREAHANGEARQTFEIALARELQKLPASSHLLMSTGDHPGALERAGMPLRHTTNETNHPQWEQALSAPAQHADYIITLDNDDVAQAVASHPDKLIPTATVNLPNAPRTTIYKSLLREPR